MHVFQLLRGLASLAIGRITSLMTRIRKRDIYILENNPELSWVFISYIPYVFYAKDRKQLISHQNQQEMIRMVEIFSELGYNIYVMDYTSKRTIPDINVKVVFGLDPVLQRACAKYKDAIKVYYATGAYYTHQTNMALRMTDDFNSFFHSHIPYRRLVAPHDSCQIADKILLIGSNYTIETYPQEVRHKISLIHQSTQISKTIDVVRVADGREFIFMASGGNALKGVGLLIRYFSMHPEYTIHIIGPIEYGVNEAIRNKLTTNVVLHGYMNVNDKHFMDILKKCNFLIYPSGSEAGSPGAVLILMKNGLIPIVSRWAAFDEIGDYGYMLDSVDIQSIDNAVKWACGLGDEQILNMKRRVKQFTEETYNLDRFASELKSFILSV